MKKVLLLISILFVSLSVFSQQQPPRVNYYYYDAEAGSENYFRVLLPIQANVYLLDNDNFQKYKDGRVFTYAFGRWVTVSSLDITPPKQQHWYLVTDRNGQKFASGRVLLFSYKELPTKP